MKFCTHSNRRGEIARRQTAVLRPVFFCLLDVFAVHFSGRIRVLAFLLVSAPVLCHFGASTCWAVLRL